MSQRTIPLSDALVEVASGVGPAWSQHRVLGATRDGLALAKEPVGKAPERYKLVEPGTIFYNPMHIMIGSIAMLDDGEEPGITSPDYVVVRPRRVHRCDAISSPARRGGRPQRTGFLES
jgi:type I restriction enzyme S subunit